jgi:hypothetical protein
MGDNKVTTDSALAPARDAAEVLRRLLALIGSLHLPQDLTPERVTQFTGLSLLRFERPSGRYVHKEFQALTDMWGYSYIWQIDSTTKLPDLGFGFDQIPEKVRRPPMTSVCQFDVAQFHDALLRLGYEHVSSVRQESPARQYRRGAVEVEIGIVGESGESLEKISHDCIKRVSIGFLTRYLDQGARP